MSHCQNITQYRTTSRALVVLFFTSLFFFYSFGLNNIFNALEIPLASTYHLSPAKMGWISSLYFWANVISLIPMGALVDRFSPKWTISAAMLFSLLSILLVASAHQLWLLVFSRVMMGIAGGCCFVGCIRIAVNWFDLQRMARASGFIVTMGMLGGFMVQSPFIALIKAIGWRSATDVVAVIGVVITLLILIFVRDCPKKMQLSYHAAKSDIPLLKSFAMVFSNKQNWLAGLSGSLINLPIVMLGALWGVPYLMKVAHLTDTQAGLVSGMLFFGTMVGCPLVGYVSDHLHRRKLPLLLGIVLSIVLIFVIMGEASASYPVLLVLFFLLGFTTSVQALSYPVVAESNPHAITSTAISIISMLMLLGGAISEPLFGWIVQRFGEMSADGSYTAASYVLGIRILPVAFVIAIVVALFLKETHAKRLK